MQYYSQASTTRLYIILKVESRQLVYTKVSL